MATYKLIQDIEAEDHILGPLSLRQFIFALVAVFLFYISFLFISKHVAFLSAITLPPGLFFLFFAVPFGRDQPTEIWALAKLRFLFKPRRRIWDQSGIKQLVTITVPKKVERVMTNGLSEIEVKSRLKALANTIDSRGWAVKGVDVNTYSYPDPLATMNSDRLIGLDSIPQQVPNYEVHAADDVLDEVSNPVAQQFNQMINQSEQSHRQAIIDQLSAPTQTFPTNYQPPTSNPAPNYWFMNPTGESPATVGVPVAQAATAEDEELLAESKAERDTTMQISNAHMKTILPPGYHTAPVGMGSSQQPVGGSSAIYQPPAIGQPPTTNSRQPVPDYQLPPPSPASPDPAILSLATNNDLNVATLAREAHKAKHEEPPDEVVISLH